MSPAFVDSDVPEPEDSGEFGELKNPQPLAAMELGRAEFEPAQMATIVGVASSLLTECYVHLDLKRTIHGVDPLGRLRALDTRVWSTNAGTDSLSEGEFHDEMISIFASLKDLHTTYVLPQPYRSHVAFLPFMIEECIDGTRTLFVVSKIHGSLEHDTFIKGVEVTHWNGIPIERAVQRNAERGMGSNRFAARARGISGLTFRWLGTSPIPDENWVTITYLADGKPRNLTMPWWFAERSERGATTGDGRQQSTGLGLDEEGEWIRQLRAELFASPPEAGTSVSPMLPDVFRWRAVPDPSAPEETARAFAYLRIYTFNVEDDAQFIFEASNILGALPSRGLILDIRGNGGGNIVAAERLLQLFSDGPIEPEPLQFRNSYSTLQISANSAFMAEDTDRREQLNWSIQMGRYTGAPFSRGMSLEPEQFYNDVGRAYAGPVVLIVDPLCYSAADIFAAGFQDNGLGHVIGTSSRTGAGGANVWGLDSLRSYATNDEGEPLWPELPADASFTIAVRRASRVRTRADDPLEDVGVIPDVAHPLTRNDVMNGNVDLIGVAIDKLKSGEPAASNGAGSPETPPAA